MKFLRSVQGYTRLDEIPNERIRDNYHVVSKRQNIWRGRSTEQRKEESPKKLSNMNQLEKEIRRPYKRRNLGQNKLTPVILEWKKDSLNYLIQIYIKILIF